MYSFVSDFSHPGCFWESCCINQRFIAKQYSKPVYLISCWETFELLFSYWYDVISYFFFFLIILFIFGCDGSLRHWLVASGAFSLVGVRRCVLQWLLWSWRTALGCTGFSSCSRWAQYLWFPGSRAQHVGSSQIRERTCVSCIGRWILYHWATREALAVFLFIESVNLFLWPYVLNISLRVP